MALDHGRGALHRNALDDVGIERPLRQEPDVREFPGRLLEDPNELAPDDLPFPLGTAHSLEPGEKALPGVHHLERDAETLLERRPDAFGFVFPEHPVIHEDAVEALSDRPVNEHRGDRRVHPARRPADHLAVSHLGPDSGNRPLRVRAGVPAAPRSTHLKSEIPEDGRAVLGVDDLGMELQPVQTALGAFERRNPRLPGACRAVKPVRQRVHEVAVARPGPEPLGNPRKKPPVPGVFELRRTVGTPGRRAHIPAALACEELHSVAHPQHRNRRGENAVGSHRGTVPIDTLRPPGENHADRFPRPDLPVRRGARQDLAVHPHFAEPTGDQLRVLRAEVEDEERLRRRHQGPTTRNPPLSGRRVLAHSSGRRTGGAIRPNCKPASLLVGTDSRIRLRRCQAPSRGRRPSLALCPTNPRPARRRSGGFAADPWAENSQPSVAEAQKEAAVTPSLLAGAVPQPTHHPQDFGIEIARTADPRTRLRVHLDQQPVLRDHHDGAGDPERGRRRPPRKRRAPALAPSFGVEAIEAVGLRGREEAPATQQRRMVKAFRESPAPPLPAGFQMHRGEIPSLVSEERQLFGGKHQGGTGHRACPRRLPADHTAGRSRG